MSEQFLVALTGLLAVIVLLVENIVIAYPSAPVRGLIRHMMGKRCEKPRRVSEDTPIDQAKRGRA